VFVSVASAWGAAIKAHLGKLTLDAASVEAFFEEQMRTNDFTYLPIAPAHVFRAARELRPAPAGSPMVGPACRLLQTLTNSSQELTQRGPTRTAIRAFVTRAFGIGGHSVVSHSKSCTHQLSPATARRTYSSGVTGPRAHARL
jgi:hypothetical protein